MERKNILKLMKTQILGDILTGWDGDLAKSDNINKSWIKGCLMTDLLQTGESDGGVLVIIHRHLEQADI